MKETSVAEAKDLQLDRVRDVMEERDLDAVVTMSPENVAYIAGVTPPSQRIVRSRHAACIVPRKGATTFVAVMLEAPVVRARSRLDEVTLYEEFVEDPMEVIARELREQGLGSSRVGVEASFVPVSDHATLVGALDGGGQLVPVDADLSRLRMVKTAAEIDVIRRIGMAAAAIQHQVAESFGAGATEQEIGTFIAERYAEEGGDGLTMLVVGSGERSAVLNAPPTQRRVETGDLVRVDIIGTSDCYYSDVARTHAVGEADEEQKRIFRLLYDVHRRLLEAIAPGVLSSDLYVLYHEAMSAAGLPPYHFVGHGLGVSLHEEPFVDAVHSLPLEAGMVLCIEPLTALDGRFGIQIEDEVLVTKDGCELLTEAGSDFLRMR
ncbi:MAG: M24 family metallopeptidase [Gaiellaceae bacterium]